MKIIFLLIACSLILAIGFLMAFFWSVKSGQNEDLEGPSMRMLMDEEIINKTKKNIENDAKRTI
mgnify:CR=1 FL=1